MGKGKRDLSRVAHHTKIIATLGPASSGEDILEHMIRAGLDVVRMNFSHGTAEFHQENAARVRRASERAGHEVAIVADLQGPKIRVGKIAGGQFSVADGEELVFDAELTGEGSRECVGLDYRELPGDVATGDVLLLDDGALTVVVKEVIGSKIVTIVQNDAVLKSNKGINKQGGGLSAAALTPKDFEDVELFGRCWRDVQNRFKTAPEALQVQETLRDMMGLMIRGTIANSRQLLEEYKIRTLDDVRNAKEIVLLPDGLALQHKQLKSQMYKKLYHHAEVAKVRQDVENVIGGLFKVYMDNPEWMALGPDGNPRVTASFTDVQRARAVCDYIAGLTDAQAYQQVRKFEPVLNAKTSLELF